MSREIMHREGPEPTEKYSPQSLSFVHSQNSLILTVFELGNCDLLFLEQVLLVGMGADEQLGGYARHRTRFE